MSKKLTLIRLYRHELTKIRKTNEIWVISEETFKLAARFLKNYPELICYKCSGRGLPMYHFLKNYVYFRDNHKNLLSDKEWGLAKDTQSKCLKIYISNGEIKKGTNHEAA